ncbi:methylenetetrahydrofolate reductase [NAD(P)H] [Enterococcus nangangensis]
MSLAPSFSFEVFPPNTVSGQQKIFATLDQLKGLAPDFISVTASNRQANIAETTLKLAAYVENQLNIPAMAHLPAAYLTKTEVENILHALNDLGIHQLLALRGDIFPDNPPQGDFHYASELVTFVKSIAPKFVISGACYPEIHPEAPSRVADVQHLQEKVAAGCDRLISQLFFDNEIFYRFQENCALAGINAELIAGVMPIVNRKQALRLIANTHCQLPRKFMAILEKYEHNPQALKAAGLAYAIDQITDLVTQGVSGVHLYTMNNAETARYIYQGTAPLFAAS